MRESTLAKASPSLPICIKADLTKPLPPSTLVHITRPAARWSPVGAEGIDRRTTGSVTTLDFQLNPRRLWMNCPWPLARDTPRSLPTRHLPWHRMRVNPHLTYFFLRLIVDLAQSVTAACCAIHWPAWLPPMPAWRARTIAWARSAT